MVDKLLIIAGMIVCGLAGFLIGPVLDDVLGVGAGFLGALTVGLPILYLGFKVYKHFVREYNAEKAQMKNDIELLKRKIDELQR